MYTFFNTSKTVEVQPNIKKLKIRLDNDGNMQKDLNKNIGTENTDGIVYNHLNLPTKITFSGNQSGAINYIYDATGAKLRKIVDDNGNITTTDYANGFVYENTGNGAVLQFFNHPEGYAIAPAISIFNGAEGYNPDEFKYIYQYKDHLGSVRLSYADDTQTLLNTSFNGTYGGFWPKGLSGTYSVTLQGGDLYVNVKEAYGGVLKRINANAIAGEQYRIKLLVDRGTTDVVRLFMSEHSDINTPEFSQYATQYLQPGVQEIEFVYTVIESGVLSLQLDKTPASALLDTETYFKILDAKIEKIGFEIIAEDNYYAFGMKHDVLGSVVNGGNHLAQKYKYNGKELQDELNLNLYDYGARNYDPAIGRWFNIDPLAEKYFDMSPYTYAGNVPTRFVDFDGRDFGINIDFKNRTITFTQTIYTDGNEKTNKLAKETTDYLNSLSGQFGLKTNKYGTFTINFSTNVVEGESENDGREKASNDNQGNFFNIEEASVGKALGVDFRTGKMYVALTQEGGDEVNFTNNDIVTVKTFKHEDLHTFGATHDAIGGDNDNYSSMNEKVLGAAFNVANDRYGNFNVKVKNYKRSYKLKAREQTPRVKVEADQANHKNGVKLKGTIIKMTQ